MDGNVVQGEDVAQTATDDALSRYRWLVLMGATMLQVGISAMQQTPAALGPIFKQELHLSGAQIGLLSSAVYAGMLVTMPVVGLIIDRHGERRVLLTAAVVMAAVGVAAGYAPTYTVLCGLFALIGMLAATGQPGGSKAIVGWFPRSQRGMAFGIRQTGITGGGMLAAILLPPLAIRFGWQVGLDVIAGIVLVAALCFGRIYHGAPSGSDVVRRVPVRSILRNRGFLVACAFVFFLVGVQGSATAYLAVFLHEEGSLSVVTAGLLLALLQAGGICGRIFWGMASDRIGHRWSIMIALSFVAAAILVAIAAVNPGTPLPLVVALVVLLGSTGLGWNGMFFAIISETVPTEATAVAVAWSIALSLPGMLLAPPLFGLITDLTGSYRVSWVALAGWVIVGAAIALLFRRAEQRAAERAALST